MPRHLIVLSAAFLTALSTAPLHAQTDDASQKSADELEQIFKKQKTRGLVIAPSSNAEATNDSATSGTAVTTTASATEYTPVDKGTDVNVRISFDFDSALLREDQKPRLTTLCEAVNSMQGEVFRIVGHTDASGSASYNERLSLLRAEEVKRYMVDSCGVSPDRLVAIGAGEAYPIDTGNPRADENRRVEFQLIS